MTTIDDRIAKLKPPLPHRCDWCERSQGLYTVERSGHFQGEGPVRIHIDPIPDLEVEGGQILDYGSEAMDQVFCCWECASDWFAEQAGRDPVAPRGHCSYGWGPGGEAA